MGTSKSFHPCSKQQQGEVFAASCTNIHDGPSTWKIYVSLLSMDAASEALQEIQLWVQLLSENPLVSPWFCLKETNRGHHGDRRGFGDLFHGYQQLQDVLKSPNAAKTLVMGRASDEWVQLPISARRGSEQSPWHHWGMESPSQLPQDGYEALTKTSLMPVFFCAQLCSSSSLGWMQESFSTWSSIPGGW